MEEFQYSMNKYGKALCRDHQHDKRLSETTKDLRALVRNRHKDELKKEIPNLKTIKDWIKADFETWDKATSECYFGKEIYSTDDYIGFIDYHKEYISRTLHRIFLNCDNLYLEK